MESYFQGSEKNNLKLVHKCENKIKICIRMPRTKNIYLAILWGKKPQTTKWSTLQEKIQREEGMWIKDKI